MQVNRRVARNCAVRGYSSCTARVSVRATGRARALRSAAARASHTSRRAASAAGLPAVELKVETNCSRSANRVVAQPSSRCVARASAGQPDPVKRTKCHRAR